MKPKTKSLTVCTCSKYTPSSRGIIGTAGIPSIAGKPKNICGCCGKYRPFDSQKETEYLLTLMSF